MTIIEFEKELVVMSAQAYVSISRAISTYIESLLRFEFPERILMHFVLASKIQPVPKDERESIETFIAGINVGRFEVHGTYRSIFVKGILAHLSDFEIAVDFEFFVSAMSRRGSRAQRQRWANMSIETRSNVVIEACLLECVVREEYRKIREYEKRVVR